MRKGSRDSFVFGPEFGRKLRQLRANAGLSQEQLCRRMARSGKNARTLIGRLETGKTRHPTLGLIADYLRACRAGFGGILDLLDAYTSRRLADEAPGRALVTKLVESLPARTAKQVGSYDIKTTVDRRLSRQEALEAEERLKRATKLAKSLGEHARVTELLRTLRLSEPVTMMKRVASSNYAHQLWAVLDKTQARTVRTRALRVADLFIKTKETGDLVEADLKLVHEAVRDLYRRLEQTGQIAVKTKPKRPSVPRIRLRPRERLPAEMRRSEDLVETARLEVNRILEREKAPQNIRLRWFRWVDKLVETALKTKPADPERDKCVERAAPAAPDPSRAAELAAVFFTTLDAYLKRT